VTDSGCDFNYKVSVEAQGFRPYSQENVVLTVNQVLRIDVKLELGQVAGAVTVSADPLALDTRSATLGYAVDNRQVTGLPMNRRQGLNLMLMLPNVQPGVGYDPTSWGNSLMITVNGIRDRQMEILFDGTPAMAVGGVGASATLPGYQPSMETVREFLLVTNSLSAEYGKTSSGMVSIASKTGTNELHGSAYDYLRNSSLGSFKRNQFGATIGGPVVLPKLFNGRNRTFFFFAYEGLRSSTGTNVVRTVPTSAMRTGNFAELANASGSPITIFDPLISAANATQTGYTRPLSSKLASLPRRHSAERSRRKPL
jgi:hypothetical protein